VLGLLACQAVDVLGRETLSQVLEAAERVGYVPNAAASALRSKRTGHIAFAMPDVSNPVYASMVRAIQEVARARNCRLVLHSTGADADEELAADPHLHSLLIAAKALGEAAAGRLAVKGAGEGLKTAVEVVQQPAQARAGCGAL
jgi:hypothetical protein